MPAYAIDERRERGATKPYYPCLPDRQLTEEGAMRARTTVGSVLGVVGLVVAMGMGCGGDNKSPGPGGSTITGNISTASTASLERSRNSLLAWVGENLIGLARTAYAQVVDTSLDGITVIA